MTSWNTTPNPLARFARVTLAARNSALWCEAVCRAHGRDTETTEDLWVCRGRPPRFYPSATTLRPGAGDAIERLGPTGFKDSFFDVDGEALGYRELFRASWIWGEAPEPGNTRLDWRRVRSDEELLEWERGWGAGDDEAAHHPRQFPPSLLEDCGVAFLFGFDGAVPVAGCALNATGRVVGLSNAFALRDELDPWPEFSSAIATVWPGRPVVGYERGEDLERAVSAGFEEAGLLRIWVRSAD
ncbi:MAG: hypothetical protein KIS66_01325 [Fimbriimonadaceae bacterium]|nr:hypothetical protein [Fimbriimonadaceae bacterium]